ncbi:hypothetical protein AGMMS50284_7570 [Clostridia bacterium]|nr:hypothetical protein AGMMS50284_7550 [Clostridia bacterium]GHU83655.1 hypothetical protein AGMMS50284_7570 [Clostridia bacterium]
MKKKNSFIILVFLLLLVTLISILLFFQKLPNGNVIESIDSTKASMEETGKADATKVTTQPQSEQGTQMIIEFPEEELGTYPPEVMDTYTRSVEIKINGRPYMCAEIPRKKEITIEDIKKIPIKSSKGEVTKNLGYPNGVFNSMTESTVSYNTYYKIADGRFVAFYFWPTHREDMDAQCLLGTVLYDSEKEIEELSGDTSAEAFRKITNEWLEYIVARDPERYAAMESKLAEAHEKLNSSN